jgi:hypothetical protein
MLELITIIIGHMLQNKLKDKELGIGFESKKLLVPESSIKNNAN